MYARNGLKGQIKHSSVTRDEATIHRRVHACPSISRTHRPLQLKPDEAGGGSSVVDLAATAALAAQRPPPHPHPPHAPSSVPPAAPRPALPERAHQPRGADDGADDCADAGWQPVQPDAKRAPSGNSADPPQTANRPDDQRPAHRVSHAARERLRLPGPAARVPWRRGRQSTAGARCRCGTPHAPLRTRITAPNIHNIAPLTSTT
eukprot:1181658-Prorocentrum_minimum.AAC.3